MSRCLRLLAALVCVAVMPLAPAAAQAPNESALVAFGGFEGLARITNDFVGRIQKHPRIGSFFKDADTERVEAMLAALDSPVDSLPVEADGAARAARMLAEMV